MVISIILTSCSPSGSPPVTPSSVAPTLEAPSPVTSPPNPIRTPGNIRPTPTPTSFTGTDIVLDCAAVYPGMPGCLSDIPLVDGRLAFVDERLPFDGRPTIIGLEETGAVTLGDVPVGLRGWSPTGAYLLTDNGVYDVDGLPVFSLAASERCLRPAWAPSGAAHARGDRLICQTDQGGLLAYPMPDGEADVLLPSGTLAGDGSDTILILENGDVVWTPDVSARAEAGLPVQDLHIHPRDDRDRDTALRLSADIREVAYQLIDQVPGTRLLLAGRGMLGASLWVDGVPLVTIDTETGAIIDLGVTMLLTSEAYAWHPSDPGLLALVVGSGRFINANKRLALLDVRTGDLTYVTAEDEVAFAPAWAHDGAWLAFVAGESTPKAEGDGETLERTLQGRAIILVHRETGKRRTLTQPGDAIDDWPRWSTDGQHLLYTRRQDRKTDVRVVAVDGSGDALLLTALPDPACVYGGCGWHRSLAYTPATARSQMSAPFAGSRAALSNYDPVQGAEAVMDHLSRDCADWLSSGRSWETLRDVIGSLPRLETAEVGVDAVDLNADGRLDIVIEPRFIGLTILACLDQGDADFTCRAMPVPSELGANPLTMGSGVLSSAIVADGRPETVITYTLQGGSGWTELLYVYRWSHMDEPDVIFHAALVKWAGRSTWRLEPNPVCPEHRQIVLTYPHLYGHGLDHKMVNHPLVRQVWRWEAEVGRFVLYREEVDFERSGSAPDRAITTEDRLRSLRLMRHLGRVSAPLISTSGSVGMRVAIPQAHLPAVPAVDPPFAGGVHLPLVRPTQHAVHANRRIKCTPPTAGGAHYPNGDVRGK